MPNFPDINPGAHVAINTGFGMTAATPLDLRTIVTDLTMLQAMIDAHWMCEGMLIYDLNTKKYYQITNENNTVSYKLFEVESSQVEQATEADHLSHSVTINGITTNFDTDHSTININRLLPAQISNYAQDFDATTTPGQYYGADGDSNNYLLTIEAIGDDKLIRTMTTIENGHIVTKQAIATKVDNVWTWGDWTLADGSVATALISWLSPNVYINIPGGSLAERWIYSDADSQYTAGTTNVQTSDGQLFTVANPPAAAIDHPFVVKLFSNGVTKTATVESLKATNDVWGKVRLIDITNGEEYDNTKGVAATPKAVATVDGRITKVNDSVAAGFSEATDYAVGDYVTHGFELYRCTTAHDAGVWNAAHFTKVTTTDELKDEATSRANADTTLQTNIDDEAIARENADATKADLTDLAADFSASTAYVVGDYVTHDGDLYRCTTAHAAGDWNAGHFKRVKVGDELKAKADLTDLAAAFSTSTTYAVGNYVTHNGNLYRCTTAHNPAGEWNGEHFTQVTVGDDLEAHKTVKGTTSAIGHVKVSGGNGLSVDANGNVAMAAANGTTKGAVGLSDAIGSTSAASAGVAATPKAISTLLAALGFKKYYFANCNSTATGGDVAVSWENTPNSLAIGDIVIINFSTAQSQMAAKNLVIGGVRYEFDTGTLAANTILAYNCTSVPQNPTNGKLSKFDIVNTVQKIPIGMITMWSGSVVPTGWALCDGTNSTPDLRNRFIMGGVMSEQYGYTTKGTTGGNDTITLAADQLPTHKHVFAGDSNIGQKFNKDTTAGAKIVPYNNATTDETSASGTGVGGRYFTSSEIYKPTTGTATEGVPTAITQKSINITPKYYALAFIMFKG